MNKEENWKIKFREETAAQPNDKLLDGYLLWAVTSLYEDNPSRDQEELEIIKTEVLNRMKRGFPEEW